jgi:four helix bundle protein
MGEIKSYRDLEVGRKSYLLTEACWTLTEEFPPRGPYGLASQIRHSALAILTNISEGQKRRTRIAFLHHLSDALKSQKELKTHLELSQQLSLISETEFTEIIAIANEVGTLLNVLIRSLKHPSSNL